MTYIIGADVSRWQGDLDFDALEADGVKFIIPKVAENGVVDPTFARTRSEAAQRGMLVAAGYAFLRPGDTEATVDKTLAFLEGLPLAIDDEQPGVTSPIVEIWTKRSEDKQGREGLGYYGLFPPQTIPALLKHWPRWMPQYPGNDAAAPRLPFWDGSSAVPDWTGEMLIWQYTGTGRLPGVAGTIDLNRLACPLPVLDAWVRTGKGVWENVPPFVAPAPAPTSATGHPLLGERDLYLHATGPDVLDAEKLLARLGFYRGALDGEYGPAMKAAVTNFQRSRSLKPVDGWLGKGITIPALVAGTPTRYVP